MNRSGKQNRWIILKLVGIKSNCDGLGTKVKITTSLGAQYNQATTAVGYNSSSDKRVSLAWARPPSWIPLNSHGRVASSRF